MSNTFHDLSGYIAQHGHQAAKALAIYKSIVKDLLRFSNGKSERREMLRSIYDRLVIITQSNTFRRLSHSLPFAADMVVFRKKLFTLLERPGAQRVRLRLSIAGRADLFAVLYEMNGVVNESLGA